MEEEAEGARRCGRVGLLLGGDHVRGDLLNVRAAVAVVGRWEKEIVRAGLGARRGVASIGQIGAPVHPLARASRAPWRGLTDRGERKGVAEGRMRQGRQHEMVDW